MDTKQRGLEAPKAKLKIKQMQTEGSSYEKRFGTDGVTSASEGIFKLRNKAVRTFPNSYWP